MIKGILFFFVVYALTYGLIGLFRALTLKEKLNVVKTLLYSGLIAGIATLIVGLIIVIF